MDIVTVRYERVKKVMLIGYARVSTLDQTLALQDDALELAKCDRVYRETASGSRVDREELAKALDALRSGDTLVVWKLDRLGRTVRQLVELVEDLRARGVAFRSITNNIDTSTPHGMFFFHVMAALAQMERDMIRERTSAGLAAARARGRKGGRRPIMSPAQVDQAKALMAQPDADPAQIAATFGMARTSLYRVLRRA